MKENIEKAIEILETSLACVSITRYTKEAIRKEVAFLKSHSKNILSDTVEIPLTNGGVTYINHEDLELVSRYSWHRDRHPALNYAKTSIRKKDKVHALRMHQLILGQKEGYEIDHIDGNGLNNCRFNLRFVTRSENIRNGHCRKNLQA